MFCMAVTAFFAGYVSGSPIPRNTARNGNEPEIERRRSGESLEALSSSTMTVKISAKAEMDALAHLRTTEASE